MVHPTFRQLEYFVAAVDGGSVTAAARRCSASQAAVSTALSDLERGLGVRLLARQAAKGVRLTPSGQHVLPIARRILDDVDELTALAEAELGEVAGPLRVACTLALSPRILPIVAERFGALHPKVGLRLVDGLASDIQELVRSGSADACILYERQLQPTGLRVVRLHEVRPCAVLAADHPLADRDAVALAELADERLIAVQPGSMGVIEALVQEAGFTPREVWSFANPETVRAMVAHGLGYSVFSGRQAHIESFDGHGIRFVPLSDPLRPNEVVLATHEGRQPTARLTALERVLSAPEIASVFH